MRVLSLTKVKLQALLKNFSKTFHLAPGWAVRNAIVVVPRDSK
jgi:hypothetical protein